VSLGSCARGDPLEGVVGDGGHVLVEVASAQVDQGLEGRGVQPCPSHRAELGGQGVGDERVGELEAARSVALRREAAGQRLVEAIEDDGRRFARDPTEDVEVERAADHAGRAEQLLCLGGEPTHASAHDVVHRGGHGGAAQGLGGVAEAAVGGQELDHLTHEEGVAPGAVVHQLRDAGIDAHRGAQPEPFGDVGAAEPRQVDPRGARLAGQLGEAVL
jgi:hypothetical protein